MHVRPLTPAVAIARRERLLRRWRKERDLTLEEQRELRRLQAYIRGESTPPEQYIAWLLDAPEDGADPFPEETPSARMSELSLDAGRAVVRTCAVRLYGDAELRALIHLFYADQAAAQDALRQAATDAQWLQHKAWEASMLRYSGGPDTKRALLRDAVAINTVELTQAVQRAMDALPPASGNNVGPPPERDRRGEQARQDTHERFERLAHLTRKGIRDALKLEAQEAR